MREFKFEPSALVVAQMPRKPVRADGIVRYQKLLDEIDAPFAADPGNSISLKEIAELTDTPVASVYYFFPGPEAALAGLAERYIELAAIETMSTRSLPVVENSIKNTLPL